MIPGFEEYTEDVTDNEIEVINVIARALNKRVGIHRAITNSQIRIAMYQNRGISISDSKLRKYIQYIRIFNLCPLLCSSSKGYWIASTKEEFIQRREAFASRVRAMSFTLACLYHHEPETNVLK